jgi:monofunctional biosynthetic peptidoglycan transglycosylase
MDDKADNASDLEASPETAGTAARAERPDARIEPVLAPPAAPDGSSASVFAVRPGDASAKPDHRVEPEFGAKSQPGGFFPSGAGLTPAGLLGGSHASAPAAMPPLATTRTFPHAAAQSAFPEPPATAVHEPPLVPTRGFSHRVRQVAKWVVIAAIAWATFMAGLIILYRFVDPPFSALMAQRWLSGESVERAFIPIDAMSPALVKAVLVSEDGRFCEHHGIDLDAIQTAIEKAGDGTPRGASTISMQVAKNLFLWPSKSYLRKALEVPLTLGIELVWPKRRIMELYLNIAEWGPGVYGAEAAARHHFSKGALHLSEREAALLAVALPNPITRDAGQPGAGTRRLAGLIQARANRASRYQTSCVLRQTGRSQQSWQPQVRREGAP